MRPDQLSLLKKSNESDSGRNPGANRSALCAKHQGTSESTICLCSRHIDICLRMFFLGSLHGQMPRLSIAVPKTRAGKL